MTEAVVFAASAVALYAGHHVGDYWVQTHHQSMHKGDRGAEGRAQCALHVISYTITQAVLLAVTILALSLQVGLTAVSVGLGVSAVTHYLADRRDFGLMMKLARLMPWKRGFLALGVPRPGREDNPSLGTGAWALDQSWHILLGVWLPALLLAALS